MCSKPQVVTRRRRPTRAVRAFLAPAPLGQVRFKHVVSPRPEYGRRQRKGPGRVIGRVRFRPVRIYRSSDARTQVRPAKDLDGSSAIPMAP